MYRYNFDKSYSYLKGYCMGKKYINSIKALAFGRDKHSEQFRKNGEKYFIHPMTMANHAISLGIDTDELIATILLHDVVEDCNVSLNDFPVSDEIKAAIKLLTWVKPSDPHEVEPAKKRYYDTISANRIASIVKIIDRCHNVSTMSGTFTTAKVKQYIDETETYVLPLIERTKDNWPEISNILFVLKYHIHSVIDSLSAGMDAKEKK